MLKALFFLGVSGYETQWEKKDHIESHAEASYFHFQYATSCDLTGVCVHNALIDFPMVEEG